jgi:choline transport protein
VPVNSIIFTVTFSCLISLINIGSTVAFNAMLSLSTVALMATYVISIACVTARRFSTSTPLPPARWSLGRAGLPVNCIALVYAVWAFFWSFWPNAYHIVAENFNYACVLFVGLMGLSCALYLIHAKKVYEGPVSTVEGRGKSG